MTRRLYAVYGAGGHGRQVMPVVVEHMEREGASASDIVFIDDHIDTALINGRRRISWAEFLSQDADERFAVIAISDSALRASLAEKCSRAGIRPLSVRANNSLIMDDVEIGPGHVLSHFVLVTSNIRIGRYFQAGHYSHVGHDCVIGDFVTFAPGVRCNGNVIVEDHAYIGTNAMLRQGKPGSPLVIGRGAVVGMGAVVTKNVPSGVTVVGNPARILQPGEMSNPSQ